jgi:hypothetical protein
MNTTWTSALMVGRPKKKSKKFSTKNISPAIISRGPSIRKRTRLLTTLKKSENGFKQEKEITPG